MSALWFVTGMLSGPAIIAVWFCVAELRNRLRKNAPPPDPSALSFDEHMTEVVKEAVGMMKSLSAANYVTWTVVDPSGDNGWEMSLRPIYGLENGKRTLTPGESASLLRHYLWMAAQDIFEIRSVAKVLASDEPPGNLETTLRSLMKVGDARPLNQQLSLFLEDKFNEASRYHKASTDLDYLRYEELREILVEQETQDDEKQALLEQIDALTVAGAAINETPQEDQ